MGGYLVVGIYQDIRLKTTRHTHTQNTLGELGCCFTLYLSVASIRSAYNVPNFWCTVYTVHTISIEAVPEKRVHFLFF